MALTMPLPLAAAPAKGLGMWVWSNSSFSTDEARQQLIGFCAKHHVSHLDIHLDISSDKEKSTLQDAEALRDLILLAGRHNITTSALRGSPKMFFFENHEQTLRELRAIIAFYNMLPAGNLFKGIKYDVEPYLTEEWKTQGKCPKAVMRDYLTFLHQARSVLHDRAPRLLLAADIPFWWDKEDLVVEFGGNTKRLSEHVQDLTDFVVIMSYKRTVEKVLDCVENERQYAKLINKVIFPSLETVELKQDPQASFWGLSSRAFWDVVPRLLEKANGDPAIGGVNIHCYRSLLANFDKETPDR
jgi:hypothetical protein